MCDTEQTGRSTGAIIATSAIYRDPYMITETHPYRIKSDVVHIPFFATSKPRDPRVHEDYEARSNRNIGLWREFLPENCVTAMIKMGWDRTT